MQLLPITFEDHPLTLIMYKGQPAWTAHDLAGALGYEDPRRLTTLLRDEWADEFEEGQDYVKIEGPEFVELKELLRLYPYDLQSGQVADARASSVILLLEPGVTGVLFKTDKQAGRRMRRWLRDVVLPELRRNGTYKMPCAKTIPELPDDAGSYERVLISLGLTGPVDPVAYRILAYLGEHLDNVKEPLSRGILCDLYRSAIHVIAKQELIDDTTTRVLRAMAWNEDRRDTWDDAEYKTVAADLNNILTTLKVLSRFTPAHPIYASVLELYSSGSTEVESTAASLRAQKAARSRRRSARTKVSS